MNGLSSHRLRPYGSSGTSQYLKIVRQIAKSLAQQEKFKYDKEPVNVSRTNKKPILR
jgi:hypothetical protein